MARIRNEKAEVPMSAMIDVVFLLLMYFIKTYQSLMPEAHVAINLPSPSEGTPPATPPKVLEIMVLPKSEFMIRGKQVTIQTLGDYLLKAGAFGSDQTVMIKVAPYAMEGSLVEVLDRCSAANLSNLNVVMMQ
jgi:biopolymer transport protein ExbD